MNEYLRLIEEAKADMAWLENNDIDIFVNAVNKAKKQEPVLGSKAAITFCPEKKKEDQTTYDEFTRVALVFGAILTGLVAMMIWVMFA